MATFNLTVTYPDADQARIAAALRTFYSVATTPEAVEKLRLSLGDTVKGIVANVERQAAASAVVRPAVT